MSTYLIHACEKRKWYVENYLIPSMLKQGIRKTDIKYYNDANKQGCLQSFIMSSYTLSDSAWHLQDDIIISSDFKGKTERYDKGIVCGFCSFYSEDVPYGEQSVENMWYSFPCIRIPNVILKDFIVWLESREVQNKYKAYIEANKFLDTLFRIYMLENRAYMRVFNLYPNIVDNIDYLLGGSTINKRDKEPVSLYFTEKNLVEDLKMELAKS